MGKSPLILAALAKDAVPSLDFVQVRPLTSTSGGSFDTALLTASTGDLYVLREPNNATAETKLATELAVLTGLNASVRTRLPFEISHLVGETKDPKGSRAYLFSYVYGSPIDIHSVHSNSNLGPSIGKATAAIHNLPLALVEGSGLPEYSPADLIKLRINEFDAAAQTGKVPATILDRWQKAFEDVNLFRFQPTVVHGELNGETMLQLDSSVSGVLGWSSLRISDPAEDLAWLMVSNPDDELLYNIMLSYQTERSAADANLRQRATLYNEFILARWLLHGYKLNDENVIEDAIGLLEELADDLENGNAPSLAPAGFAAATSAFVEADDYAAPSYSEPVFDEPIYEQSAQTQFESDATAQLEIIEISEEPTAAEPKPASKQNSDDELF